MHIYSHTLTHKCIIAAMDACLDGTDYYYYNLPAMATGWIRHHHTDTDTDTPYPFIRIRGFRIFTHHITHTFLFFIFFNQHC